MSDNFKWEIIIETGPTAADCHSVIFDAPSTAIALDKAEQWAKDRNYMHPMFGRPRKVPAINDIQDADYTDIVEWTAEEEETFLNILNKPT